jgi:hypothetical protein
VAQDVVVELPIFLFYSTQGLYLCYSDDLGGCSCHSDLFAMLTRGGLTCGCAELLSWPCRRIRQSAPLTMDDHDGRPRVTPQVVGTLHHTTRRPHNPFETLAPATHHCVPSWPLTCTLKLLILPLSPICRPTTTDDHESRHTFRYSPPHHTAYKQPTQDTDTTSASLRSVMALRHHLDIVHFTTFALSAAGPPRPTTYE